MEVKPIPDGFHAITPYLTINGAKQLINFLKEAFDAKKVSCLEGEGEKIMNAELKIGDSMIMVADAREPSQAMPACIYLYTEDTDDLYNRAIKAGAESLMEPADQFYGDRNAGVKDFAGNQWWIATRKENLTEAEINERMKKAFAAEG